MQWFGAAQLVETSVRCGLVNAAGVISSLYDMCPAVLRAATLVAKYRQQCSDALELLTKPLSEYQHNHAQART